MYYITMLLRDIQGVLEDSLVIMRFGHLSYFFLVQLFTHMINYCFIWPMLSLAIYVITGFSPEVNSTSVISLHPRFYLCDFI